MMVAIREIMTKNPLFLSQHANVNRARKLMSEKRIRHVPIKDAESGRLIGIIDQKALLANAIKIISKHSFEQLEHIEKSMEIAQIMNSNPQIVNLNDSVKSVANSLLELRSGCVVVEDNGSLVGVVTSSDFVKLAANSMID